MENKLVEGRMISASKSGYRNRYPKNLALFNANIFNEDNKKIWWGDLDITKDIKALKELAKNEGKTIFILREMDGRFENEEKGLLHRYVIKISPEGKYELGEYFKEIYNEKNLKLIL